MCTQTLILVREALIPLEDDTMKILLFTIGLIVGGLFGIVTMCLVQINRNTEEVLKKEDDNYEKEIKK